MLTLFLKFIRRRFLYVVILILIIIAVLFAIFYDGGTTFVNKKNGANTEAKILAERVGEHMFLPQDEVPTVATVSDPEALKDQSFFEHAKKGDKVLIYSNAKLAILYDPSADKIITIAPLSLDEKDKKINNKPLLNNNF